MQEEVIRWLDKFAKAVRERDFATGLTLYDPQATAFGTRVNWAQDAQTYLAGQWQPIWNSSTGYEFTEILRIDSSGELIAISTLWTNHTEIAGKVVERSGRASFVLRRQGGSLVAIQSHYSENPKLA